MAITSDDFTIPLAPVADNSIVGGVHASFWPLPNRRYSYEDYGFAARRFYDDEWEDGESPTGQYVFYFHGSGATDFLPTMGNIIQSFVDAGIGVIQALLWGVGASPASPYRYNYGNVNSPGFMSSFIRNAIWPEACYKWAINNLPVNSNFVFLGHSRGAAACLTWSANYMGRSVSGNFNYRYRGIVANGPTIGGLGDENWNDVVRNLNTLTNMAYLARGKVILLFGDEDAYGPPDYARRMQMALQATRQVYVISPGAMVHDWIGLSPANANLARMWVHQLLTNDVVTQRDGTTPAIVGVAEDIPLEPEDTPAPFQIEAENFDVSNTGYANLPAQVFGNLVNEPYSFTEVLVVTYSPGSGGAITIVFSGQHIPFFENKRVYINGELVVPLTSETWSSIPSFGTVWQAVGVSEYAFEEGETYTIEFK